MAMGGLRLYSDGEERGWRESESQERNSTVWVGGEKNPNADNRGRGKPKDGVGKPGRTEASKGGV